MCGKKKAVLVYDGQAAFARSQETYQQRKLAKALYKAGIFVPKRIKVECVYIKHIFTGEFVKISESDVAEYRSHGVTIYRF